MQHRSLFARLVALLFLAGSAAFPAAAANQPPSNSADRADPGLTREQRGDQDPSRTRSDAAPLAAAEAPTVTAVPRVSVSGGAIRVEGAVVLTPADFAPAIEPWLGRRL